jgi:hypothetical protein
VGPAAFAHFSALVLLVGSVVRAFAMLAQRVEKFEFLIQNKFHLIEFIERQQMTFENVQ